MITPLDYGREVLLSNQILLDLFFLYGDTPPNNTNEDQKCYTEHRLSIKGVCVYNFIYMKFKAGKINLIAIFEAEVWKRYINDYKEGKKI